MPCIKYKMSNGSNRDDYYQKTSSGDTNSSYYRDNHTEVEGSIGDAGGGQKETPPKKTNYNSNSDSRTPKKQPSQAYKIPPKKKEKKSHWKKGVAILIIAALLIFLFLNPLFNYSSLFYSGPVYPEKAEFTIERTLTVSSTEQISYNIDVPVPLDIPGNNIQHIQSIDWSASSPRSEEKYGQEWKIWSGDLVGTKTIDVTYQVKTETIDWGYTAEDSGLVSNIDQDLKDQYNHNQWQVTEDGEPVDRDNDGRGDWMIDPDSEKIHNLALDITEGETTIYDKAYALYQWLNDNIEYERAGSGLPQHSLWTLSERKGDCDEQSFLFCSLARSIGIPAWIELGVLYDRVINEWGGHGWVRMEFFSSDGNSGWVNIDPVNDQFFARDATRFTNWIDDGIDGHMKDYYLFLNYTYSSVGQAPQVEISDEYVNQDMDEEGEVYLGDDNQNIPGFEATLLAPILITTILIYDKIKFKGSRF